MMAAVKLLETFTRRDQYIVLAGSLFLLLAACLDRQGLLRAPLYLLEGVAVLRGLCECCVLSGDGHDSTDAWQEASKDPGTSAGSGSIAASVPVAPFDNRAALAVAGRALLYAIPLAVRVIHPSSPASLAPSGRCRVPTTLGPASATP